jgi:Mg2+/citrate symporter
MITDLGSLLIVVFILIIVVGIIGFMDKKGWKMLDKLLDKIQPYVPATLGVIIALIIGIAVAIPIFEMSDYGLLCENNNWTGIHQTNDKRYWLFGDKITLLCVNDLDQKSNITSIVKVVKKSESMMYNQNLSGLD